jgi:hypothetical protein
MDVFMHYPFVRWTYDYETCWFKNSKTTAMRVLKQRVADDLGDNVGRRAQRTVGVREIAAGMGMDCLKRSAEKNKPNTEQAKEKLPRRLALRFWAGYRHAISNIAH